LVEGSDNAEWVLMDYVNIVVHVFLKNKLENITNKLVGDNPSQIKVSLASLIQLFLLYFLIYQLCGSSSL
jgi:hypothetical protein